MVAGTVVMLLLLPRCCCPVFVVSDSSTSGIFVQESAPAGAPIAVHRETIAAFIGPAPRGPADIPVAVRSVNEYLRRFGCPDKRSRLQDCLTLFFDNGGSVAVIVRACQSQSRAQIRLPAGEEYLELQALCPGSFEYLRASVDHEGIPAGETARFNLVVQRLDSKMRPLVVEQEIYRDVSIDPDSPVFIGHVLLDSALVRLSGESPGSRPASTMSSLAEGESYIYANSVDTAQKTLTDYDLIGSATEGTGLYALEQIPRLDLLCLLPPVEGADLGPVAMFAAERYCQRRHVLLLVDPPCHWNSVHAVVNDRQARGLDSPNVMTYFPRPVSGSLCGAIAGALVASDANSAVWQRVLDGLSLRVPVSLKQELDLSDVAVLNRFGVNAVVRTSSSRVDLYGMLTLGRRAGLSPEWYRLDLRRTVLFVLAGITRSARWALFRSGDRTMYEQLRSQIETYLDALHFDGALAGAVREDAWYLHGPFEHAGELTLELGIALRRPGEFLSFRFSQGRSGCDVRELGWQPALALAG